MTCAWQDLFEKRGGRVEATLCPDVTHVLCPKVRSALSHSLDHRTVLGGIVRGRIVPHTRLTCGMRWQPSQRMVLSKVASTLGIDSEEEALQTLRGEPPHSAPIAPYVMTS